MMVPVINGQGNMSKELCEAIKTRYAAIRNTLPTVTEISNKDGRGYIYNGHRTEPDSIAHYFGRPWPSVGFQHHDTSNVTVEGLLAGEFDYMIRDVFFERANAQYYYTYEKDYGSFE